jgi:glutaredoxin 3
VYEHHSSGIYIELSLDRRYQLKNVKISSDTSNKSANTAMQPNIEIYTWQSCPFCIRAKALLKDKGVEFIEHSIDGDEQARAAMAKRGNGKRSVPQIFIDDNHLGGCDDIYDLDARDKLDSLLGIA